MCKLHNLKDETFIVLLMFKICGKLAKSVELLN
jgi:hypothetical protein